MPPQETEIKLEGDPREAEALRLRLERWLGAPDRVETLTSRYFDTAGADLRRAGLTLRVREKAGGFVQTVKRAGGATGGLHRRDEWETVVASATPDVAAANVTPAGGVLEAAGAPLRSAFRSAVTRRTWTVRRPPDSLVEVALDHGDIATTDGITSLLEVELELKGGPVEALVGLLRELPPDAGLTVGVLSKSDRGHALLEGACEAYKAEPIGLRPGMDAAEGLQAILRSCLRQVRLNEPGALARSGPALHQARVGVRRLRSALALFADVLEDDRLGELAAQLRGLSGVLGEARNLDVIIARLDVTGGDALRARLASRRVAAYDRVIETLRASAHGRLLVDLLCWIEAGGWVGAARLIGIEQVAADALRWGRHAVRRRGRHFGRLSPDKRHRLRIVGKKLRYATEFVAGLAVRPGARRRHAAFAHALERLQETLGDLNDLQTARALAAEIEGGAPGLRAAVDASADEPRLLAKAARLRRKLLATRRFWRDWD